MDALTDLDGDVTDLLVAGAALATGSAKLAGRRRELDALAQRLGERAPALRQLASLLDAALAPKESLPATAAALLALATGSSRVRAAQAKLASVEGPVTPFPPAPPLGNRCGAQLLHEVREALERRNNWSEVRKAVERETVADLRLAPVVARALAQRLTDTEEALLVRAATLFGPALAPEVRRLPATARTVRVLASIVTEPTDADRALLLAALSSPDEEVRDETFDAVARLFPDDPAFGSTVMASLSRPSEALLRCAGTYARDEALDACLAALATDLRGAAAEGLARSRHPRAAERLLARLDVARGDEARAVLRALAGHRHPALAKRAVPHLDAHGVWAARLILAADDATALAALATRLAGPEEPLFAPAARAAARLVRDEAWRFLTGPFRAKDRRTPLGLARLKAAMGALAPGADRRWHDLLLDEVRLDPEPLAAHVLRAFGRMKDHAGVSEILRQFGTRANLQADLVEALADVGDPAHFEAALGLLAEARGITAPGARLVRLLARKETLPALRAFAARNASYRGVLGDLERQFGST